jgi:hypothetical protein
MFIFERNPVITENQQPVPAPLAVRHEVKDSGASKQVECDTFYLSNHRCLEIELGLSEDKPVIY